MHSRHPSRPLPDLSMQRVLTATIQGKKSFSSGYVWWMGPEELLFWCHEQANVGDDFRLRIDWAQGTALLGCTAMVHNIVSRRITSVKEGNALYATFKLVDPADRDTLTTGLLRDNPTLKAHGLGHLPSLLAPSRHKAELRLKRKLGQGGAAAPSAPPGVGRQAVTRRRASAGRLTSPSGKRAVSAAAGGGASQPKTQSPALPGQPTAHCASAAPTPQRLTAERGKHDERSETDELIPVPSVDGANKDFSSSPSGDGGKYMGRATTSGRSLLASKPGSATARLKAMAGRLRKRAGDNTGPRLHGGSPGSGRRGGGGGRVGSPPHHQPGQGAAPRNISAHRRSRPTPPGRGAHRSLP